VVVMDNKNKSTMNESMFSQIDLIRQDSKDVRDFVKKVFSDREFKSMSKDTDFIKYLKSIYEGTVLDEDQVKFSSRDSSGNITTTVREETINEAIKGKNNKTGESFGMVIGSDKKNREGNFEVTIRKTYSSRITSYKFIFDNSSNLIEIADYGYSMDGKFPDMKGRASVKSVKPTPRETITQIAKVTSPAFAKKIYQHVSKVNTVNEIAKFAGWVAIDHKGKRLEIKKSEAKDLYNAKLFAIKKLKVPKSKESMLVIKPGYNESIEEARDPNLYYVLYRKIGKSGNPASAGYESKTDAEKFAKSLSKTHTIMVLPKQMVKGMKVESVVTEAAGKEAMGIAAFTATRGKAVQKFIDDYNLDAKKLYKFISKGNLSDRMDFVTAIAGNPGNKYQGKIVGMFGESVPQGYNPMVEDKKQIKDLVKKVKHEKLFYDVLVTMEKKYGKNKYRIWLEKSLKDFGVNPKHYDYRTNAAVEEKLYQLGK
jgi:hypothetical protein